MVQLRYLVNELSVVDGLPLFSDLSSLQKRLIATKSQIVEFKKGQVIYEKGDPPGYFYCMVTGRVELYQPPEKAERPQGLIIECIRRGDYFGSISSLTGQPHSVSARALNDSVILRINTKNFNYILQRIPKLAIFMSHSLSRRLSQRPYKRIFESTIIAIYSLDDDSSSSVYAKDLAEGLRRESGKRVLIIESASISSKEEASSKLSSFTEDYHYVLVDVSARLDQVNFEILKQSDICHILTSSHKDSLCKTSVLIKRLEGLFSKYAKQTVFVILKEDGFYAETSYADKLRILSKEIFASLPQDGINYKKAIRRIARQTSGVMVGLALGSGAAMGLAHIGVLKILEQEKIPVDIISATSMGALIAALWTGGFTASEIERLACGFRSKLRTLFLVDPTLPIRGLIRGKAVKRILKSYLGDKTFLDIKLPLKVVACDIKRRREFIIDKGSLVDAVMASIAIPGVFEPVEYSGDIQLVDGGLVNPVPISVLSKLGIKRIVAVNTLPSPQDLVRIGRKRFNIYDVIVNSVQAMEFTIAENSCQQADVYIHPIPEFADWYEFYKAGLFIKTGRDHTRGALPEIKRLVKR